MAVAGWMNQEQKQIVDYFAKRTESSVHRSSPAGWTITSDAA
jgi:hypothetical protein